MLVQATKGHWTMDGGATITAGGGDVLGLAETNITLGVISLTNTTANRVALSAGGSILDANGTGVNIQETDSGATTSVSLRSTGGSIGQASAVSGAATNSNALDLNVDTVAASAASGIYLRELAAGGAIRVDTAASVMVKIDGVVRSDFDSSTTSVAESRGRGSLEDLVTTANGSIELVADAGTITVNRGTPTTPGVIANGTGDTLLEARGAASDVVINADVFGGTGTDRKSVV